MKMSEIIKMLETTKELDDIEKVKSNIDTIIHTLRNQKLRDYF